MSLSDYLPTVIAVAAVGIGYLFAVRGIKEVTKQEIRTQPLEQILKSMGFKNAKFTDLNKLTPEAFGMLRQLFFDFYTYTKPPATGANSTLAQLVEMGKAMQGINQPQTTKAPDNRDGGVPT